MKKLLTSITLMITLILISSISYAQFFCPVPKGTIHRAYVDYENDTHVIITSGYGECNGEYWEILSDTIYELQNIPYGEGFVYIYIDDSESAYPIVSLTDTDGTSTTPTWSDSKQGWYNGDDRCIGVVWSPSGSTTVLAFYYSDNGKYSYPDKIKTLVNSGNPTTAPTSYTELTNANNYFPVNASEISLYCWCYKSSSSPKMRVSCSSVNDNMGIYIYGYNAVSTHQWLPLKLNTSNAIYWFADTSSNGHCIKLTGYKINR